MNKLEKGLITVGVISTLIAGGSFIYDIIKNKPSTKTDILLDVGFVSLLGGMGRTIYNKLGEKNYNINK